MAVKLAGKGKRFDLGQNSDINVTPFVDVMLVLLIIFMVTAPLATVSIKIDLPPAKAPPPNQHDKPPTYISISKTGIFISLSATEMKQSNLEKLSVDLADVGFVRIERSLLVNIGAVSYVESVGRGTFAFTLSSGSCLHSSASYRDSILRALPMRRLSTRRVAR